VSSDLKSALKNTFNGLSVAQMEKFERLKFTFLSIIFFFIIAAYTLILNLKSSVFMGIIGKEYVPVAKLAAMIFFIPAILFYSKLVDRVKKYYLLSFYSIFYIISCLIFAFFIGHPTIGILNTDQSPYRIFGWFFYIVSEGFSPFVLSVFWAFSNSISAPEGAKKGYGNMVSASKLGGILTAVLAWALFSFTSPLTGLGKIFNFLLVSDIAKIQIIFIISAICLMVVPITVLLLIRKVPASCLHGYEAVYSAEKDMREAGKADTGIFAGLKMFLKYPYVLGIFGMIFFYEVLHTILNYLKLGVAEKAGGTIAGTSAFLFGWEIVMHSVGLLISFFGTTALLRKLGTRACVFLIPILMGAIVLCFIFTSNSTVAMVAFTLITSLHYAFEKPVVESLYIPTLKEIKFKSKAWIDAFGRTAARSAGSIFNLLPTIFSSGGAVFSFVFAFVIGAWTITAFLMGRRFDKAIETNEAIGAESK